MKRRACKGNWFVKEYAFCSAWKYNQSQMPIWKVGLPEGCIIMTGCRVPEKFPEDYKIHPHLSDDDIEAESEGD